MHLEMGTSPRAQPTTPLGTSPLYFEPLKGRGRKQGAYVTRPPVAGLMRSAVKAEGVVRQDGQTCSGLAKPPACDSSSKAMRRAIDKDSDLDLHWLGNVSALKLFRAAEGSKGREGKAAKGERWSAGARWGQRRGRLKGREEGGKTTSSICGGATLRWTPKRDELGLRGGEGKSGLKAVRRTAQPGRASSTSMDRRIGSGWPDGEGERGQMAVAEGRVLERRSEGGERARHKAGTQCKGSTTTSQVETPRSSRTPDTWLMGTARTGLWRVEKETCWKETGTRFI
ncbi:hypothetical protein B0H14DRAFT_2565345 [Mycena olivaceomarginata]|nr:hypothetical protein B0H14DRAFT_2565345 [Mycena olivaceomarginata]